MNALPSPPPPRSASADSDFDRWMSELDVLHELRARDPADALLRLQQQRRAWRGLMPAEEALLHLRASLHVLSTHLTLGEFEVARPLVDDLDVQLQAAPLQELPPELRPRLFRVVIAIRNARAFLAHGTGDFPGALRAYLRALEAAQAAGDRNYQARVRVNLANTFEESGLHVQALEEGSAALVLARELGLDELVADIHHNMGNAMASMGRPEEGLESNRAAQRAFAQLGLSQKQVYAAVAVAERLLELGRAAEAAQALSESSALPAGYVNLPCQAYVAYLSGRVCVAQGQPDEARQHFALAIGLAAGPLGDRVGQARSQLQLAHIDLGQGQLELAWAQGCQALQLLAGSKAHRDLMLAHELLSRVAKQRGDLAAALSHHEAFHQGYALSFNEESARKAQVLAVRHELDLARGQAQRERVENARLSEALAEIGARLSRAKGEGRPGPEGDARPEDLRSLGLTPREAEVLHWVTCGKTNEDVALILGMGLSGVKKHLRSIFEKLGVENRTAAANAARQRQAAPQVRG